MVVLFVWYIAQPFFFLFMYHILSTYRLLASLTSRKHSANFLLTLFTDFPLTLHLFSVSYSLLPDDFGFPVSFQVIVCPAEMLVAEETVVGRKGRRVG